MILFSSLGFPQGTPPPGLSKPLDLPAMPGAKANDLPDYTSGAKRVEEEGKVQFRSDNIPVRFPVIVNDHNGRPVTSLKQDSFHVFEDGSEQKITSFEEVTASTDALPPAQTTGPFTNLPPVALEPRRLTVVLIDTVNSSILDEREARSSLIDYLSSKASFDHAISLLILGSKGSEVICPLSADPSQVGDFLRKQATRSNPGSQSNPAPSGEACNSASLQHFVSTGDPGASELKPDRAIELTSQAFLETAWRLAGIPGKKSLVWLTEGFPFALKTPTTLPGGTQSVVYERALAALHDADTSVYPVNLRAIAQAPPNAEGAKRRWLETSTLDMLTNFASMTGGRAFLDKKDVGDALKNAASDASSYYLVGYELNTRDKKPGWRQLTVKVANPDYQVLARNGFLVSNSVYDPELSRTSDLDIAAASPLDSTAIPLTAAFQGISGKGNRRKADFAVVVRGDSVTFGQHGGNHFQLDVLTIAEKGGKQVAKLTQVVQGGLPADQLAVVKAHGVGYKNSLELPPGDYTVRFIVRDKLSGKVGTLSAPLSIQ
jgi:VWFA-related protein